MKKRLVTVVALLATVAMAATGCQASLGVENDNVKITQYKDLQVEDVADAEEITDETVENTINTTLSDNATEKKITNRAVKSGDTVNIDFVGKIDGEKFDGGSASGYDLVIGSGSFIDGFEDSVIGHKIGDKYDWNGKFPDDYSNTDYAGKDVTFTIKVNSITETEVPELTDKFVQSVSEESKTVEEYKEEVKKQLEEDAEDTFKSNLEEAAWSMVMDNTEVLNYPEDDVKSYEDQINNTYKKYAEYYGIELDEFVEEQLGMTMDEYNEQVTESAKTSVKKDLATEAIADKEKITLSDKEYKSKLKEMAEQYGYENSKALLEDVGEDYVPILKKMMLNEKVLDWLADNCTRVKN